MSTEIATRNFTDVYRYPWILPKIAEILKLDTSNNLNMWKDLVVIELNIAVMHSFNKAGVSIVDHYSASENFVKHYQKEV